MMTPMLIETSRGSFNTIVDGPEDGPVVLLLHGFPELNVSWRHQIPVLAAAGYRVLAPNQRGYQGSSRDGSYRTEDLAADAVSLLDAVGADTATVVGHDWGGGVAWTVAGLYPQRVSSLVALNCPPPSVLGRAFMTNPRQLSKSWYMFFFLLPMLPERFVVTAMPGALIGGSARREAWNRENLAPYIDAFATPADARGPVNWYRAALRHPVRSARNAGHKITVDTMIIWGVLDRFLAQELVSPAALLPVFAYPRSAQVEWIPDAGHFVQNEQPEQVNALLLDWLASH